LKPEVFQEAISSSMIGYKTKDGKVEITKVGKAEGEVREVK
jgi:hypothetical protein